MVCKVRSQNGAGAHLTKLTVNSTPFSPSFGRRDDANYFTDHFKITQYEFFDWVKVMLEGPLSLKLFSQLNQSKKVL